MDPDKIKGNQENINELCCSLSFAPPSIYVKACPLGYSYGEKSDHLEGALWEFFRTLWAGPSKGTVEPQPFLPCCFLTEVKGFALDMLPPCQGSKA